MGNSNDTTDIYTMDGHTSPINVPLTRSESVESMGSISSVDSSSSSRVKKWFCEYEGCSKAFSRPSQLTEHQEVVHQGIKPFQCTVCARQFSRKTHLERHMFSHSEDKPFKCSYCGKGVTTKQQLRRHEITHTRSFVCPHEGCEESFYKHPQLRAHILAFHLQKLNCEICGKRFQRPYRLKNHIAKHHNPDVVQKYQCSQGSCVEAFKTWSALQQHMKETHPKLQCPECGKACVGEQGLQMHMKIHSNAVIKNWKCETCNDLYFAKKIDLMAHYMEHHKDLVSSLKSDDDQAESSLSNGCPEETKSVEATTRRKRSKRLVPDRAQESELDSIATEVHLKKYLDSGKSSISLLLNSAGRKLKCPYLKCYRTFKTEEKYEMHIQKHKIHELKLKILQDKEQNNVLDHKGADPNSGNVQDLPSSPGAKLGAKV